LISKKLTQGDEDHAEDLGPGAQEDGEQHSFARRPKYVSVDELPAEVFLHVFAAVHLVVASDVLVKCPQHDHSDHPREKQDDHQRVENTEPLDIGVWTGLQNVVPP